MKTLKYLIPVLLSLFIISCSDDDDDKIVDETAGLLKVQEFKNDTHIIEAFTESGQFVQGYNDITLRIKDIASNSYIENAQINWMPVMHMMMHSHSCPKSAVAKVPNSQTIFNGYIVFQMPENSEEGWDLTFDYSINGTDYNAKADIRVPMSEKKVVTTFTGPDEVRYVLALMEPRDPQVAINTMRVGLFRMENMMSFPVVPNYSILLDPRMPSMGNHSSPNNEDLHFNAAMNCYDGKLSLTMTGYWKLNLILLNAQNEVIKGEEITETNEGSSLYLEIEF